MKIHFRDYSLWAGSTPIYGGLDLTCQGPGATVILGPSGIGKSSLLRAATRLHEIDAETRWRHTGDIRVDGTSIHAATVNPVELRRRLALVLQSPVMLRGTVRDQFALVLRETTSFPRASWERRTVDALHRVGLSDLAGDLSTRARDLSGGQVQRLAIAMRLACEPAALLFDEPTSALDPRAARRIGELIRDLASERLVLVVTHDVPLAEAVAQRVILLDRVEGRAQVAAEGSAEHLRDPAHPLGAFSLS